MHEDAGLGAELRINWCESAKEIRIASTLWLQSVLLTPAL